ncbi:hypothetical protein DSO57_1024634 [Entomophthora muscae]|uniref:Uncharacterized protein n=1 Tax=Entomophthora muscae TaxID=34485 RepID=A0ACC2U101_9FUNG|nr:hypothetical protein DSO57_1024634 [Entomophthora muscae]
MLLKAFGCILMSNWYGKTPSTRLEPQDPAGSQPAGPTARLLGLTILSLWKTGPGSGNQTPTLGPPGLLGLWTAHPRILGTNLLQADTKNAGPCNETSQTKEIIAPNRRLITVPNGGTEAATISFMDLKSTPVANQELSQERGTGPRPGLMTTTLKQDNQVAKLRFLTNERTPGLSTIFLPLDLSIQFPWACLSQCPDEPLMEIIKFGGGVLYRPKDPMLQTYCHF